jgi:hypothetical protein
MLSPKRKEKTREQDKTRPMTLPATHDIAVTRKDLGEATHNNVGKRNHINVLEIPESVINHDGKGVLVCQLPQLDNVHTLEQWV